MCAFLLSVASSLRERYGSSFEMDTCVEHFRSEHGEMPIGSVLVDNAKSLKRFAGLRNVAMDHSFSLTNARLDKGKAALETLTSRRFATN